MNIAICISGGIKFPQKSLNSIKKIHPNSNLKIFIHTWYIENQKSFNNNSWSRNTPQLDIKNVLNQYRYESLLVENFEEKISYFKKILIDNNFINLKRGDLGVISMFYSIYKSNELKCNYEKSNQIIFDKVVRMRFDSDLINDLDTNQLNEETLNIPNENDWGGINDQFAVGGSKIMDVYSNVFNNLPNLTDCVYHPETLLLNHLIKNNCIINRFDYHVKINNS